MAERRVARLVLGLGNVLCGDDGVGVHAVRALAGLDLGAEVEVVDGGTCGVALLDLVADRALVVVVDAVAGGLAPGTIYGLEAEDVARDAAAPWSLHQAGLHELLAMARLLGCAPRRLEVVGVEPATLALGLALSPAVAAALPRVLELVRERVRPGAAG